MNYLKIAQEILNQVGGQENVIAFEHCATRLRLILKDSDKLNQTKLTNIVGVKGYFYQSGQHQVILGTGVVNKVFDNFSKICNVVQTTNVKEEAYKNMTPGQKLVRIFADIFLPLIPALVTTGLALGLIGLLPKIGIHIPDKSMLKIFLDILSGTAFGWLPVLVAWSATKKFGGNPVLGILIGLMLVFPALPNAYEVANGSAKSLKVFNFIPVTGYQGSLLPAIFAGWFISLIQRNLQKIIPNVLDLIVTPFLSVIITLTLVLFGIGPLLHGIEYYVTKLTIFLLNAPLGIGSIFIGATQQLLTITGLHHSLGAIEQQLITQTHFNPMNALMSASMAGQFGAAIGVATMLKGLKKTDAISSSLSTFVGITEPLLFGVSIVYNSLWVGMIGGGLGGLVSYIFHVKATGFGITFIPGLLLYLNDLGFSGMLGYILVITTAFSSAFIIARIFLKNKITNI